MDHPFITQLDALYANSDGYAVYYPADGYLSGIGDLDSTIRHRESTLDLYPDAYVVRVLIERVDNNG